mmetsp:Transcript_43136/g.104067  ORF Transcript_43136/g.104067 Transcript_43136/m.104067 type:complete len:204 (+) Transcript_43136:16-627(+)
MSTVVPDSLLVMSAYDVSIRHGFLAFEATTNDRPQRRASSLPARVAQPMAAGDVVSEWLVQYRKTHVKSVVQLVEPPTQSSSRRCPAQQKVALKHGQGITTLMIRNIPHTCVEEDMIGAIAEMGFADSYDYICFPKTRNRNTLAGFGFINFVTPELASSFAFAVKKYRFPGASALRLRATVAPAQGKEANESRTDQHIVAMRR